MKRNIIEGSNLEISFHRSMDKSKKELLTIGGGAPLAVRLIIRQILVLQRCGGPHGQAEQIAIVTVVKLHFADRVFA